jgi:hypothetical protein
MTGKVASFQIEDIEPTAENSLFNSHIKKEPGKLSIFPFLGGKR